ncbi:MAG: glutamate racemase [Fusobacteriia bacterium 4572_132]|nr:MAG: glutamate racemase [Fusobacteriia bacterium 4572_132]
MEKRGIGVFDSGLGGLTVVKEIMKLLPNEKIIYFGDTARVPYGSKSELVIKKYSLEITKFLKTKDIKILVVACNTATAMAIKKIREVVDIPVVGVIEPGSRRAVKTSENGNIGIIGTSGTINSNSYKKAIKKINQNINVLQKACPLFVPLIEEGMLNDFITEEIIKRYLMEFKEKIDTLVLGCTHYPLIKKAIKKVLGNEIILIDSAEETAIEVREILYSKRLLRNDKSEKSEFYVSDAPQKFTEIGEIFLGKELGEVKLIDIEKYGEN